MKPHANEYSQELERYFRKADIHTERAEIRGGLLTFSLALALCGLELRMIDLLMEGSWPPLYGYAVHSACVLVVAAYAYWKRRDDEENRFAFLLLMSLAGLGPLGSAGVMLTIAINTLRIQEKNSFTQLFASLFPRLSKGRSQRIYEDLRLGRDESAQLYDVIPFAEVMAYGNDVQKRSALAKIAVNFNPRFAVPLKRALEDSSNPIRVQAAATIARIEKRFQETLNELTGLMSRHPNDPAVLRILANLYDDYSYTGLLDPARELQNRESALNLYRDYIQLVPDDVVAGMRAGRLLMRKGDYAQAAEWFQRLIKPSGMHASLAAWYAESLFRCGRYDELRAFLQTRPISELCSGMPAELQEAFALWSAGEAA